MKYMSFNFNVSIIVPFETEQSWKFAQGKLIKVIYDAVKKLKFPYGKNRRLSVNFVSKKELTDLDLV